MCFLAYKNLEVFRHSHDKEVKYQFFFHFKISAIIFSILNKDRYLKIRFLVRSRLINTKRDIHDKSHNKRGNIILIYKSKSGEMRNVFLQSCCE